jgi:hypothetical protein
MGVFVATYLGQAITHTLSGISLAHQCRDGKGFTEASLTLECAEYTDIHFDSWNGFLLGTCDEIRVTAWVWIKSE